MVVEREASTSGSESSVDLNYSDAEFEGEARDGRLVRFSSSSSHGSPPCDSAVDPFVHLQFEQPIFSVSFETQNDLFPFLMPVKSSLNFTIPQGNLANFCEGALSPRTALVPTPPIPRSPKSTREPSVEFYLFFHRQTIMEGHYFLCFDYNKFITTTLLAMAEESDALRHAVAGFSALIYSIKVDRTAREDAFENYAVSLKRLRIVLDQLFMTAAERQAATATALQLASFDVPSSCIRLTLAVFRGSCKMFSTFTRSGTYHSKIL